MKRLNNKLTAPIIGFLVLFGIFGGILIHKAVSGRKETTEDTITYYTFAEVEKPVSYLASDEDTKYKLSRLIDPLYKSDNIDVIYVEQMTRALGLDESIYSDLLKGMDEDAWVPAEAFDEIYERIIDSGEIEGIEKQSVFIHRVTYYDETESLLVNSTEDAYATPEDAQETEPLATVGTATGDAVPSGEDTASDPAGGTATAIFDGETEYRVDQVYIPDRFLKKVVTVYMRDGVIFRLGNESDETVCFRNVWVESCSTEGCTFLLDQELETFPVNTEVVEKERSVANISYNNTGIVGIEYMDETIKGRVTSVSSDGIRLDEGGLYPCDDAYRVYNVSESQPQQEITSNMLLGYQAIRLYIADGKVQAAVIEDKIASDNIRVILNDSSYSSYKYESVDISGEGSFTVTVNEEEPQHYEAGDSVRFTPKDYNVKDVIKVVCDDSANKLTINNITRNGINPSYRGTLELTIKNDYLYVVNDLPLEEYLYAVVSSEVPSSYELEAQKALAICARGYAYSKMQDSSYAAYGAHVDDSTMCQVYNSNPETETSIFVVKDTYGIVPVYEDEVITPFYFSTSAGVTCTNDDIWGGNAYGYLTSHVESLKKQQIDLSEESAFRSFLADSNGYDTLEKDLPFYRWSIRFTNQEISEAINSNLAERIEKSDGGIQVQKSNGKFSKQNIETIGEVESIEITKRSASGVILEMEIYGSENVILVSGQTNIRNLISPENVGIVRNDGSIVTGWTSLPSPFYYVDQVQGGFEIVGGGFGHGVGMSQNGAELLAEQGYSYKFILAHYYNDIELKNIYDTEEENTEEDN